MAEQSTKEEVKKYKLFRLLDIILRTIGVDLFGSKSLCLKMTVYFMLAITLLAALQQAISTIHLKELEVRIAMMSTTLVITGFFVKLLLLETNLDHFHTIFGILNQLASRQVEDPAHERIIMKAEGNIRFVVKFFLWVHTITHCDLLFSSVMHNLQEPDDLKMPLQTWFPYDAFSNSIVFNLSFFWVAFSLTMVTVVATGMRTVFCATNIYIVAQLRILQEIYTGFSKTVTNNDEAHRYIVKIAEHHKVIIRLVDLMNAVFAYAQLFEVVTSSMQCCLLAYMCSKSMHDPTKIGFFLPLLFGCVSSLFIICFTGQMLNDESMKLYEVAYEIPWYELNPRSRLEYLFLLRQSSRPLRVHVKQTFPMDMAVFLSTMQSAYSLLAIVNSMESN